MTGIARLGVLCTGLVAPAVGVGLGPRHHAAEGLGTGALTGYLLLAGGLVAALWAAGRVLRVTRRRWWAPVVALLLVATALALWTLGQAVAASFPPRPALDGRTPADIGLTYRDVTFPSSDGVELAGWYVPSRNGAAVVLMHGAGSTRSAVLDHARVLADHGYGVLLFDARGHGESAGRGMDFGWYGEQDASGAVDFLTQRPDVESGRIGLVGMSMGGEQAIGAAGADERVRAVVAEGATHRVAARQGLPRCVRRARRAAAARRPRHLRPRRPADGCTGTRVAAALRVGRHATNRSRGLPPDRGRRGARRVPRGRSRAGG